MMIFTRLDYVLNQREAFMRKLMSPKFNAEKGGSLELEFDTLDIDDTDDNEIMYAVYDISDIYGLISILNCLMGSNKN